MAGLAKGLISPRMFVDTTGRGMITTLSSGFLIGVGTWIGRCCTSGHCIYGIGRLSARYMACGSIHGCWKWNGLDYQSSVSRLTMIEVLRSRENLISLAVGFVFGIGVAPSVE